MSSPSSIASSSADNIPPSRRAPPPPQRSVTPTPTPQEPPIPSEPPRFQNKGRHGRHKGRRGGKAAAAPVPVVASASSSDLSNNSELPSTNTDTTMADANGQDGTQQSKDTAASNSIAATESETPAPQLPDDDMDVDNVPPGTTDLLTTPSSASTRNYNFRQRGNGRKHGGRNNQNHSKSSNNHNTQGSLPSQQKRGGKAGGGVKRNYGHLNRHNHPPTSSSTLNRVRSITSSGNNATLPGQRMPIVSTWDIPPPIPRNQQQEQQQQQQQKCERPTWDHYTNLSLDDLDHAKDLVLDLLGWGVDPQYLLDSGVSAELIHRVFTDLNLRLPHNFVPPPPSPHSPRARVALAS